MSLAHFLHDYNENPSWGSYYDNSWLSDSGFGAFGTFGHVWRPDWSAVYPVPYQSVPAEWHEGETLYTIHIEIPGVRKDDVTMHVSEDGRTLHIEGKVEKFGGARGLSIEKGEDRIERPRITKVRKTMADGSTIIISRLEKKHNVGTTVKFTRSITLPDSVDPKRVAAKLENGVLTATIQKRTPVHKPRRIIID